MAVGYLPSLFTKVEFANPVKKYLGVYLFYNKMEC